MALTPTDVLIDNHVASLEHAILTIDQATSSLERLEANRDEIRYSHHSELVHALRRLRASVNQLEDTLGLIAPAR